jgi:D-arginine dehydrogenase
MTLRCDVAIVGAGIAGASLAAALGCRAGSVLLIEAEDQPGYHSTGRSAAFWMESYGGAHVQPLATASGPFLRNNGFLRPRGALHLADEAGRAGLRDMEAEVGGRVRLEPVDGPALRERLPGLRPAWREALFEPSCSDIDVAALHARFLVDARQAGARIVTGARVSRIRREEGGWRLDSATGAIEAAIIVNAAGAWADSVAELAGLAPLGLQPYRRTLVQLRVDPPAPADMPLVIDALGRFYFKPEAGGRVWASPHDEIPAHPCDCAPEEIDVALAVDRFESVVDWRVEAVERRWAGLRTFAPDRVPVYGFDPRAPGFFWCAGQGGFGIQTAPAAGRLAAALLTGDEPELDPGPYAPGRFLN